MVAVEAVLFDNDGVLVDTEGLYFRATREVLAAHGVALDEAAYVQLFLREARGAWHLLRARAARDRRYADLIDGADVEPQNPQRVPNLPRSAPAAEPPSPHALLMPGAAA